MIVLKLKKEYLLLGVILAFGFFLRIYALGSTPFWTDEAISSLAALNILEKGLPFFDSGFLYSRALLFHYIQSFFLLFGNTAFLARLPSAFFGLLTILLGYKIGKEYSKSGGIIVALFLAISFLEVSFSRQARFYQLFQLLFFATVYCLYKAKDNPRYLYVSLILFLVTINTQIQGIILAPFLMFHFIFKTKKKWLAVVPFVFLGFGLFRRTSLFSLRLHSPFSYFQNMLYVGILFIPGVVMSYQRKRYLTLLLVLPAFLAFFGALFLRVEALRYLYVFVFPLVVFSSLFVSYLYEKYGKVMLVVLLILVIIPSNLFFSTGTVILSPQTTFYDTTAPVIDYDSLPPAVREDLLNGVIVTYFSPSVAWSLRTPDYVIPFSLNGIGSDQVSYMMDNEVVDVYSGSPLFPGTLNESFYLLVDQFAQQKLTSLQQEHLLELITSCSLVYENPTLTIYDC